MSNKKFNLKILMLASWVLLFFAWIFFYAVTQRPTITFLIVLSISAIITIITVILERKSIITLFRMRFVHKAFFGILSLIIILAILIGLYLELSLSLTYDRRKEYFNKRKQFMKTKIWLNLTEIFLQRQLLLLVMNTIQLFLAMILR